MMARMKTRTNDQGTGDDNSGDSEGEVNKMTMTMATTTAPQCCRKQLLAGWKQGWG